MKPRIKINLSNFPCNYRDRDHDYCYNISVYWVVCLTAIILPRRDIENSRSPKSPQYMVRSYTDILISLDVKTRTARYWTREVEGFWSDISTKFSLHPGKAQKPKLRFGSYGLHTSSLCCWSGCSTAASYTWTTKGSVAWNVTSFIQSSDKPEGLRTPWATSTYSFKAPNIHRRTMNSPSRTRY